jgi:hypothetical protein
MRIFSKYPLCHYVSTNDDDLAWVRGRDGFPKPQPVGIHGIEVVRLAAGISMVA